MSAFGVTKLPWRPGKAKGTIVADEPVKLKTGHDDVEYYGGNLICESIAKMADRDFIIKATAAYDDLELMLWALSHGWRVHKLNSDGFVGWTWKAPTIDDGNGLLMISVSTNDAAPCVDDHVRSLLKEKRKANENRPA